MRQEDAVFSFIYANNEAQEFTRTSGSEATEVTVYTRLGTLTLK